MFLHDVDEILFFSKGKNLKVLNAYDDILSLFDSNDVMKSYIFFMYRTETPWLLSKHFR